MLCTVKSKGLHATCHQWHRGIAVLMLNLGASRGTCSVPRPDHFTPGRSPRTPCKGSQVGLRTFLGQVQKISLPSGFKSQAIQPLVNCYTDYTILAHQIYCVILLMHMVATEVMCRFYSLWMQFGSSFAVFFVQL